MKIDDLVTEYIELRDKKAAVAAKARELSKSIDEKLDALEAKILETFAEVGVESAKTSAGTAYKMVARQTSVGQWDDFFGWVKTTENWQMLQRAASKTAVLEYADSVGELPPGINLYPKITLGVTRPRPDRKSSNLNHNEGN